MTDRSQPSAPAAGPPPVPPPRLRPPRGTPRLLFVDRGVPADAPGTPVVVWRHLNRLESDGWQVRVAAFEPELTEAAPPSWHLVTYPLRRRWWPPHRAFVPGSLSVRASLQSREIVSALDGDLPDIVLTTLSPEFSTVAAAVASRLGRPLAVIVHDQPELWESVAGDLAGQRRVARQVRAVLHQAARVYPVTQALAEAYGPDVAAKSHRLLPIPAGGLPAPAEWSPRYARPHIVHAGSLHSFQRPNIEAVARALGSVGGRLTIVSHHDMAPFEDLARAFAHVTLRPAFPSSRDALAFCAAEASALLVSYSFSEQPWAATSFPSKMVEFAHLGLPQLLLAPPDAAASVWAREQGWTSHVEVLNADALPAEVVSLATRDGWTRRAGDSHRAAAGPFDPETIHARFAESLEALLPVGLRRG